MTVPFTIIALAGRDRGDAATWHASLVRAVQDTGRNAEIVYAISDRCSGARMALESRRHEGPPFEILTLTHWYDETAAVRAALQRTATPAIVTVTVGTAVDGRRLEDLLMALERADLAVPTGRCPRVLADRMAIRLFGAPLAAGGDRPRAFRRSALERVADGSVSFPLLPLYAAWQGLRLAEVASGCMQPPRSRPWHAVTDGLSVLLLYALLDFAKRPLRLFGVVGVTALLIGLTITIPPVLDRLLDGRALADNPGLLPGLLLTALGLQCGVIGLVAELLVFMRSRALADGAGGRVVG